MACADPVGIAVGVEHVNLRPTLSPTLEEAALYREGDC